MGIDFARLRNLDTANLTTSADTAVTVGKDVETRAGEIVDLLKGDVAAIWAGLDAETQADLLGALPPPLQAASSVFKAAAGALDALVTELEGAKADIETAISSYPEHTVAEDGTVSWPPSPDAATQARLAEQAKDLFTLLMKAVERADSADQAATGQLAQQNPNGGQGLVPVTLPDGSVYLATGDDDNEVKISNDADGKLVATVDGKEVKFDPGTRLTVDGQGGDDKIDVDKNVKEDVTVLGGDDDDTITGSDKANVLDGGEGDDVIDGRGGEDTIVGGDGENTLRGGDGKDTIVGGDDADEIHGGEGDDRIDAGGNSTGYDVVYGNDGDDTINGGDGDDRVAGGAGDDTISGGQGKDYLDGQKGDDKISGGTENDVIYGLDGQDVLYGEEGDDYLEGGQHNDRIDGGIGNDTISGGYGEDSLSGGEGNDVLYGGHGKDTVDGGSGADRAYVQEEDSITKDQYGTDTAERKDVEISDNADVFAVEGTEDFKARVQADLDMMAASPTGQQMLDAQDAEFGGLDDFLQPGEDKLTIKELTFDPNNPTRDLENGYAGWGSDDWNNTQSVIEYNPAKSLDDAGSAPSNVLYHEMAHVYDARLGQYDAELHNEPPNVGVEKGERNAVGLPIDHDDNPSPDSPMQRPDNHPWALTENGLREEQGRPLREKY